jgi:hypothetical protein
MQRFRQKHAKSFARTKDICMIGSSYLTLDASKFSSGRVSLEKGRIIELIREDVRPTKFAIRTSVHKSGDVIHIDNLNGISMDLPKGVPVIIGRTDRNEVDFLTNCYERGIFSVTFDGKCLFSEAMDPVGFYVRYILATSSHLLQGDPQIVHHNNASKLQQVIQNVLKNGDCDKSNVTIPVCVSINGNVIAKEQESITEEHFVFMILYNQMTKRIVEGHVDHEFGDDIPSKADHKTAEIFESSMDLYNVLPKKWSS